MLDSSLALNGSAGRAQILPAPAGRGRLGVAVLRIAGEDELLPEPIRMLPRELPCQRVNGPHSFDRHQEGFVFGEASAFEGSDLLTEVIFQLLRVRARDRSAPTEVGQPRRDLILERVQRGV